MSSLKAGIPFLFIALFYLFIRFLSVGMNTSIKGVSFFASRLDIYAVSLLRLLGWYVSKLVFPRDILFLWSDRLQYELFFQEGSPQVTFFSPFNGLAFGQLSISFILVGAIIWILWKGERNATTFALAFFLVGLLPCGYVCFNYFPQVKPMIEPHWFYFSSIGFFILLSSFLFFLKDRISGPVWTLLLVVLLSGYFFSGRFHNRWWANQETYCRYWISLNQNHNTPFRGLGYLFLEEGDYVRAVEAFRKSMKASQDVNARMFSSYAYALYCSGEKSEGQQYIQQSFMMDPQYSLVHYYWGNIY